MKGMSMNTSITHALRRTVAAGALGALALTLTLTAAACGSDSTTSSASTAAPTTTVPAGAVSVAKPWARTSAAGAANGAAYFTINSPVDDTLTGVSVEASVAKMAQMHETTMAGGMPGTTMAGATTSAPQMSMKEVSKVDLKAGMAVEFKPGGYHIMLMELAKPLKVGDTVTLTLTLAKAGTVTVQAPVLDQAP